MYNLIQILFVNKPQNVITKVALLQSSFQAYLETKCIPSYTFSDRLKFIVLNIDKTASKNFKEKERR